MVIPGMMAPKARSDGRGGTAKSAPKRSKAKPKAAKKAKPKAAKKAEPKAAKKAKAKSSEIIVSDAVPFEETDGFQIFRAKPATGKGKKKSSRGKKAAAKAAPELPAAPNPERDPNAPGAEDMHQSEIGRWMAGAIKAIVHDEMQRSVDRITRSVVQETVAKNGRGK